MAVLYTFTLSLPLTITPSSLTYFIVSSPSSKELVRLNGDTINILQIIIVKEIINMVIESSDN